MCSAQREKNPVHPSKQMQNVCLCVCIPKLLMSVPELLKILASVEYSQISCVRWKANMLKQMQHFLTSMGEQRYLTTALLVAGCLYIFIYFKVAGNFDVWSFPLNSRKTASLFILLISNYYSRCISLTLYTEDERPFLYDRNSHSLKRIQVFV